MENKISKSVVEYLRDAEEPKSFYDIAEALQYSNTPLKNALKQLLESGEIVVVNASGNRKYYIANNEGITAGDFAKMKTKSLEMLVPAKAASDDAKQEIENMRKEIKNIYANFISIMAVFVAIFSIVFAGANFLFQIANGAWTWHALVAFLVVELGVVLAILIMLWGIKKFLYK